MNDHLFISAGASTCDRSMCAACGVVRSDHYVGSTDLDAALMWAGASNTGAEAYETILDLVHEVQFLRAQAARLA